MTDNLPAPTSGSPMEVLHALMQDGDVTQNVEALNAVLDASIRWEEKEAKKALHRALAAFRGECPPILKERSVTTSSGGRARYHYASLDDIERVVRPLMDKHGLFFTHDQEVDGNRMTVTCWIHHEDGASISSKWTGPAEDGGHMQGIQKAGSATTYARRYSLVNALGLTTTDQDDDGMSTGSGSTPEFITPAQVKELQAKMKSINMPEKRMAGFLKAMGVSEITAIPGADFRKASALLDRAVAQAKKS